LSDQRADGATKELRGPRDEHRPAAADELDERAAHGKQQDENEECELHAHKTGGRRAFFRRIAGVKVGVVGLGTMGAGIAQISVTAGHETVGREVTSELGERGRATIDRYLTRGVEKQRLTQGERDAALARLTLTTQVDDLADCDLVIEAIVEELEPKRELFAELDRLTRPDAVLATNTSALSVTEIAEAATEHPERVVGMHFFNPAPVLPLVEIVRARRSSDDAVRTAYEWAEQAGKRPVGCNDTPGFIVNRILIPLLNDCVRLLDESSVSPEDLDTALTNGAGWPMGPCALVDLVGIDVHVHASEALHAQLGEARMAPPARLVEMQRAGKLGRKSGEGFFRYES
jgi:3-hydroxybutyryl-CoA dehydrogenase